MDGAADLLVEQDLLREAVDAVVGADSELAQPARALVRVERLEQELLVSLGGRVDDRPSSNRSFTPDDLAAAVDRGIAEGDLAVRRVLDRAR